MVPCRSCVSPSLWQQKGSVLDMGTSISRLFQILSTPMATKPLATLLDDQRCCRLCASGSGVATEYKWFGWSVLNCVDLVCVDGTTSHPALCCMSPFSAVNSSWPKGRHEKMKWTWHRMSKRNNISVGHDACKALSTITAAYCKFKRDIHSMFCKSPHGFNSSGNLELCGGTVETLIPITYARQIPRRIRPFSPCKF